MWDQLEQRGDSAVVPQGRFSMPSELLEGDPLPWGSPKHSEVTVVPAKRPRLCAARKAAGHTQESLAEALGVDRSTSGRWEAGETEPQPWLRPRLATALRVSHNELAAMLGGTGSGAKVISPSAPANLSSLDALRRNLNDAMTESHVTGNSLDDWEQTVAEHGRASRDRPPAITLTHLSADLAELHQELGDCRSLTARRRLTGTVARMAGLMCLALIKLDERPAFRGWARTARIAVSEADDALTYSWVRAQEAHGHYYSGDFAEAIVVAQHAQHLASRTPCVGAVLAAALEARAHAARGDHRSTRTALANAEMLLSLLDDTVVTDSAFGYTEAQLRFHEGNAFTHLHDTALAWSAQQRALTLCPAGDYMDRTLTLLDRADCLAHDGELDGALLCMADALGSLSERQREGIITARAQTTLAALPPMQRSLPAVHELRDLLADPERPNHT